MHKSKAVRNFLLAFCATAAIIVVGASLANSGDHDDGAGGSSTSGDTARPAPDTELSAPLDTTTVAPTLTPFAVAELDAFCESTFGPGYGIDLLPNDELGCSPGDGTSTTQIDKNAPCVAQLGPDSRIVAPAVDDVWRCSPLEQVELGKPDYDKGCQFLYGDQSRPTLWANDWLGWRCAALPNGIYTAHPLSLDEICAVTFGADTVGGRVDDSADGWRCYGAA